MPSNIVENPEKDKMLDAPFSTLRGPGNLYDQSDNELWSSLNYKTLNEDGENYTYYKTQIETPQSIINWKFAFTSLFKHKYNEGISIKTFFTNPPSDPSPTFGQFFEVVEKGSNYYSVNGISVSTVAVILDVSGTSLSFKTESDDLIKDLNFSSYCRFPFDPRKICPREETITKEGVNIFSSESPMFPLKTNRVRVTLTIKDHPEDPTPFSRLNGVHCGTVNLSFLSLFKYDDEETKESAKIILYGILQYEIPTAGGIIPDPPPTFVIFRGEQNYPLDKVGSQMPNPIIFNNMLSGSGVKLDPNVYTELAPYSDFYDIGSGGIVTMFLTGNNPQMLGETEVENIVLQDPFGKDYCGIFTDFVNGFPDNDNLPFKYLNTPSKYKVSDYLDKYQVNAIPVTHDSITFNISDSEVLMNEIVLISEVSKNGYYRLAGLYPISVYSIAEENLKITKKQMQENKEDPNSIFVKVFTSDSLLEYEGDRGDYICNYLFTGVEFNQDAITNLLTSDSHFSTNEDVRSVEPENAFASNWNLSSDWYELNGDFNVGDTVYVSGTFAKRRYSRHIFQMHTKIPTIADTLNKYNNSTLDLDRKIAVFSFTPCLMYDNDEEFYMDIWRMSEVEATPDLMYRHMLKSYIGDNSAPLIEGKKMPVFYAGDINGIIKVSVDVYGIYSSETIYPRSLLNVKWFNAYLIQMGLISISDTGVETLINDGVIVTLSKPGDPPIEGGKLNYSGTTFLFDISNKVNEKKKDVDKIPYIKELAMAIQVLSKNREFVGQTIGEVKRLDIKTESGIGIDDLSYCKFKTSGFQGKFSATAIVGQDNGVGTISTPSIISEFCETGVNSFKSDIDSNTKINFLEEFLSEIKRSTQYIDFISNSSASDSSDWSAEFIDCHDPDPTGTYCECDTAIPCAGGKDPLGPCYECAPSEGKLCPNITSIVKGNNSWSEDYSSGKLTYSFSQSFLDGHVSSCIPDSDFPGFMFNGIILSYPNGRVSPAGTYKVTVTTSGQFGIKVSYTDILNGAVEINIKSSLAKVIPLQTCGSLITFTINDLRKSRADASANQTVTISVEPQDIVPFKVDKWAYPIATGVKTVITSPILFNENYFYKNTNFYIESFGIKRTNDSINSSSVEDFTNSISSDAIDFLYKINIFTDWPIEWMSMLPLGKTHNNRYNGFFISPAPYSKYALLTYYDERAATVSYQKISPYCVSSASNGILLKAFPLNPDYEKEFIKTQDGIINIEKYNDVYLYDLFAEDNAAFYNTNLYYIDPCPPFCVGQKPFPSYLTYIYMYPVPVTSVDLYGSERYVYARGIEINTIDGAISQKIEDSSSYYKKEITLSKVDETRMVGSVPSVDSKFDYIKSVSLKGTGKGKSDKPSDKPETYGNIGISISTIGSPHPDGFGGQSFEWYASHQPYYTIEDNNSYLINIPGLSQTPNTLVGTDYYSKDRYCNILFQHTDNRVQYNSNVINNISISDTSTRTIDSRYSQAGIIGVHGNISEIEPKINVEILKKEKYDSNRSVGNNPFSVIDSKDNYYVFYEDYDNGNTRENPNISVLVSHDQGRSWLRHNNILRLLIGESARLPYIAFNKKTDTVYLIFLLNDQFLAVKKVELNLFIDEDSFYSYDRFAVFDEYTNEDIGLENFSNQGKQLRKERIDLIEGNIWFKNDIVADILDEFAENEKRLTKKTMQDSEGNIIKLGIRIKNTSLDSVNPYLTKPVVFTSVPISINGIKDISFSGYIDSSGVLRVIYTLDYDIDTPRTINSPSLTEEYIPSRGLCSIKSTYDYVNWDYSIKNFYLHKPTPEVLFSPMTMADYKSEIAYEILHDNDYVANNYSESISGNSSANSMIKVIYNDISDNLVLTFSGEGYDDSDEINYRRNYIVSLPNKYFKFMQDNSVKILKIARGQGSTISKEEKDSIERIMYLFYTKTDLVDSSIGEVVSGFFIPDGTLKLYNSYGQIIYNPILSCYPVRQEKKK